MKLVYLYCLYWLLFSSYNLFGNSICGEKDYSLIEESCLKKSEGEFQSQLVPLSAINPGEVFFYKTDKGKLGKMYIHHLSFNKNECSLHVDFETYDKVDFSRSASFKINNYLGVWSDKAINLDSYGTGRDIKLVSKNGKYQENGTFDTKGANSKEHHCYLETLGSQIFFAGKVEEELKIKNLLLMIASILLIGFAVFNIAKLIFDDEEEYKKVEGFEESKTEVITNKDGLILKYSTPFFRRYLNPVVNGLKNKKNIQGKYKRILSTAGISRLITPIDFFSFKLFSILTFPILYLVFRELMAASWPLYLVPLMALIGFIYPDIWIKSRAEKRKKEIILQLPFIVDMLALSVGTRFCCCFI